MSAGSITTPRGGTRVSCASGTTALIVPPRPATTTPTAARTPMMTRTSTRSTARSCHAGLVSEVLRLGQRSFASTDRLVMAIVNRTPDSFYDRGATFEDEAALERVDAAVAAGVRNHDTGGVRTGH